MLDLAMPRGGIREGVQTGVTKCVTVGSLTSKRPATTTGGSSLAPNRWRPSLAVELQRVQSWLGRANAEFSQRLRIEQKLRIDAPGDQRVDLAIDPQLLEHHRCPCVDEAGRHTVSP